MNDEGIVEETLKSGWLEIVLEYLSKDAPAPV